MTRALPLVRTKLADGTETRLGQARLVFTNATGVSTLHLPGFGQHQVPYRVSDESLSLVLGSWLSARPLEGFLTDGERAIAVHEALKRENLVELVAMASLWSGTRVDNLFDVSSVLDAGERLFDEWLEKAGSSRADVTRISKARPKIGRPVVPASRFDGLRVAVAFNIPLCRRSQAPRESEACYSIRLKPGGKVYGYVSVMRLRSVHYWVSQAGIDRIRNRNREVCCYMVGDVVAAKRPGPSQWEEIRFNPFKHRCFVNETGECVRESDWAFFGRRKTFASGLTLGEPHGPRRKTN